MIRASGTPEKPISWVAVPGSSQPIFRGSLRVEGAWNRVSGMLFEGPSGTIKENGGREDVLVWLNGNGDRLDHCEVRGSAGHAGVFVSHSEGFSIDHDYIHNNGVTYNLDHGVYVSSAEASGKIEANVIARNYAWGVHLYPEVSGVLVDHNTIVENGRGGVIVANASARNRIDENIVADNREYGIRGYELTGTGNEATDNLLWNQPFETTGAGMTFRENIVADPQFVGPGDFHLQGNSPAIGAGHSGGGFDIEGNGRGTPSDLGAYEFLGPSE